MEPIRVLQVLGGTGLGGAESRVMDSYRHMDRERIQFDFCVHSSAPGFFDEEIQALGGRIFRVPRFRVYNWISYRKAFRQLFREHPEFAAVHGHMTSTASIYLPIAKKAGIPLTIAHARSAGTDPGLKGAMTRFLRRNLGKKADVCLTCSKLAGEAVFGKRMQESGAVQTIPNAIDAADFSFQEKKREEIRAKYGLQGAFVIGHVGRFGFMKNHLFLLDVFAEVKKVLPKAKLLMVGEGGTMEQVKAKGASLGLLSDLVFTGNQGSVSDFYQAMDYFVFPSLFEGLPGSVVEAQAAGLRCLISDLVTEEVVITELAEQKSLEDGAAAWAGTVLAKKDYARTDRTCEIEQAGFDIHRQVEMLQKIYGLNRGQG